MSALEQALIPTVAGAPSPGVTGDAARWHALRDVPLRLSVDIPLPAMSLRALGALQPGQVLPSAVATADDLMVVIGGSPVCQARFEYMEGRMSIRITRLTGLAGHSGTAAAAAAPAAGGGA